MQTINDLVNQDGTVTRTITSQRVMTFSADQYKGLLSVETQKLTDQQAFVDTLQANVQQSQASVPKPLPPITPPNQ